jgi:hypothetical protein
MGCCLLALVAWISPRFVMALLWVFTDRLEIAFRSGLVGLAGFFFLPYTSVLWAIAYAPGAGVTGVGWLLVAGGAVADLGSWMGGDRGRKRRRRRRDDD